MKRLSTVQIYPSSPRSILLLCRGGGESLQLPFCRKAKLLIPKTVFSLRFLIVISRKPARSMRKVLAPADQQSRTKETTNADLSPILENTKKRKTLFNSRENSIVISCTKNQVCDEKQHTLCSSKILAGRSWLGPQGVVVCPLWYIMGWEGKRWEVDLCKRLSVLLLTLHGNCPL